MAYDPTSRDFLPIKHVGALISRSSTFQTWTGAATATEALVFVHYEIVSDPKNETMPFAIVGMEEGSQQSELRAIGDHEIRGTVTARFLNTVDDTKDLDEQLFVFADKVSAIKEEMVADARVYGFRLTSAAIPDKPFLGSYEDRKSRGAYAFATIAVGYVD